MAHVTIIYDHSDVERFFSKVKKTETCWLWTGCTNQYGYGRMANKHHKSGIAAHRLSYTIHKGEIPKGLFICHTCDNPKCVNPDHLYAGTMKQNMKDICIRKRTRHFKKSQYYGVRKSDAHEFNDNKWKSLISIAGKNLHLAYHDCPLEAARNYDRIAYIKYGIRDKLNFPEQYV